MFIFPQSPRVQSQTLQHKLLWEMIRSPENEALQARDPDTR